jgi:hypothetical protein
VPFGQSELLHLAAGLGAGTDVGFLPVLDNGHGGPGFQQMIGSVNAFFDARLRDVPATRVSVVASDPAATEAGDPGAFLVQRSGPVTEALLVRLWAGGSAEPGADCEALAQLVQIPANASSVTLAVVPRQDARVEGDEMVVLRVCAAPAPRSIPAWRTTSRPQSCAAACLPSPRSTRAAGERRPVADDLFPWDPRIPARRHRRRHLRLQDRRCHRPRS